MDAYDPEAAACAAVSRLSRCVSIYWARYDAAGIRLGGDVPLLSQCAVSSHCPLLLADGVCSVALVQTLDSDRGGGIVVGCGGPPGIPLREEIAHALLEGFENRLRAEREMESTVRELAATYQELSIAYGILETMSLPSSRETIAQAALTHLRMAVRCSGAIMVCLCGSNEAAIWAQQGLDTAQAQSLAQVLQQAALEQLRDDRVLPLQYDKHSVLAVVVQMADAAHGVIAICRGANESFSSREGKLLRATGRQAGLAIRNRSLVEELRSLFVSTIQALVAAIEAKDAYTCGHSRRVADTARATAICLGLPDIQVEDIHTAAIVHDVGKIAIDTAILRKPARLSDMEWQAVKLHPDRGASIIGCIPQLRHILAAVRHHHERTDGNGYPFGLREAEIPLEARVIAVCDAYDAMTSRRPYREAMPIEKAHQELTHGAGSQFDSTVVEAFLAHCA